jgi:hypothetical protein
MVLAEVAGKVMMGSESERITTLVSPSGMVETPRL